MQAGRRYGLFAYLKALAFASADPRYAWRAATSAARSALDRAGLTLSQMGLIEVHEAFAAQVLANLNELGLTEDDFDRINVNGSCIAIGHPLGATGARILTTLVYEMHRRAVRYGLIAICGEGGMAIAAIIATH